MAFYPYEFLECESNILKLLSDILNTATVWNKPENKFVNTFSQQTETLLKNGG